MTICTACGAENVEGARFCVKCGAGISAAPDPGAWRATEEA
ncbi:MAG: zinc-ribbon domain-containing protein, partial [Pyrinomonadaceae bacterium]